MIAGATPLIATALGATAAEPAAARADDSAKIEFAAILNAMMQATTTESVKARVTLDALADATATDEEAVESDEEESTAESDSTSDIRRASDETTIASTRAVVAASTARDASTTVVSSTAASTARDASTTGLDAEFAGRLGRVLDRMRAAGHRVELRETLRTNARQQELYAQGRTTDGPVVTWTLDSRHIDGKAADVLVDGRAAGKGYALLHEIANDEGLRTLGARDPGHLELPRTTDEARAAAAARRSASDVVVRPFRQGGMLAALAQVARVAQVASTARVAVPGAYVYGARSATTAESSQGVTLTGSATVRGTTRPTVTVTTVATTTASESVGAARSSADAFDPILATVPTDGNDDGTGRNASNSASSNTSNATADTARDQRASDQRASDQRASDQRASDQRASDQQDARNTAGGRGGRDTRDSDRDVADARPVRQGRSRLGAGLLAFARDLAARSTGEQMSESMQLLGARSGAGSVVGAAPIMRAGSLAAERVAELLAARDAQPAGALGELRLAMDPVRDGLSEVRLALQNGALDATLRTSDLGFARGLQAEISTLTRALERQGFDTARVSVQLEAAQQARATALDTVAASEATARGRAVRGDSDASSEGREQQTAPDTNRKQQREEQRDQQRAQQFGTRRQRQF